MFTSVDYHIVILLSLQLSPYSYFFFFNDTATTEIYTLSLHDALPISFGQLVHAVEQEDGNEEGGAGLVLRQVIFGGEALEPESLRPWFDRFGDESPQLVNMYGITETTVHVTYQIGRAHV